MSWTDILIRRLNFKLENFRVDAYYKQHFEKIINCIVTAVAHELVHNRHCSKFVA